MSATFELIHNARAVDLRLAVFLCDSDETAADPASEVLEVTLLYTAGRIETLRY